MCIFYSHSDVTNNVCVNVCQELDELVRNTGRLEAEIAQLRADVTERQAAYAALQEQHARDLDDMRSADHRALAIIVEEYKVSMCTCGSRSWPGQGQKLNFHLVGHHSVYVLLYVCLCANDDYEIHLDAFSCYDCCGLLYRSCARRRY